MVSVDFSRQPFRLTTLEADTIEAKCVIVATGARANYLGLKSESEYMNRGVSACAVCDGALPRFRNHPLVVVGGGDSAIEEATYLSKFASKVYLVHRRDELRASKIMAERAKKDPKVEMVLNHTLEEVQGNEKHGVTGVRLRSTVDNREHVREATGLFLAIGHTPNTAFLKAQVELTDEEIYSLDRTVPDEHQCRGRIRRGRRGRRLLSPGRHRRRHRLHGGARRRALAVARGALIIFSRRACPARVRGERHNSSARASPAAKKARRTTSAGGVFLL